MTVYDAENGSPIGCPSLALKEYSIATIENEFGERELAPFISGRIPAPFKDGQIHFYHPHSTSLGANLYSRCFMAGRFKKMREGMAQ